MVAGEPVTARLAVSDAGHRPERGATLRVDAHMSHPGMAPVSAPMAERAPGNYEARVNLSMGGDWIFVVSGRLADGRPLTGHVTRFVEPGSSPADRSR